LETSDLPGGVVNILTGGRDHLCRSVMDLKTVNSVWYFGSEDGAKYLEYRAANSLKYVWASYGIERDWTNEEQGQNAEIYWKSVKVKDIWIPSGDIFAN